MAKEMISELRHKDGTPMRKYNSPKLQEIEMENKQTAVEWLIEQFAKYYAIHQLDEEIEQAKQMEKEQIIEAYKRESAFMKHVGCTDDMIDKSSIKYYNETYGKE